MTKQKTLKTEYKVIGYYLEYFVDGKFIGSKPCEQDAARNLGWAGKRFAYATSDIKLDRNKTIKAGTKYYTYYNQLCGKLKGTHDEKVTNLYNLNAWRIK
jgi:hypothetical protein|tara:strand:- start:2572 stop:2871 length:300 start_codon:yes stop_codon:yes gene_type:complete